MDNKDLFSQMCTPIKKMVRALVPLILVVVVAILLLLCGWLWTALDVKCPQDGLSFMDFVTRITFPILTGIVALVALYLTFRRTEAIERQTSQMDRKITVKAFKDAVDQLGHRNQAVVIGGIYALHKIARNDKDEYAQTVADILCGYVRERTSRQKYKEGFCQRNLDGMQKKSQSAVIADSSVQTVIDLLFRIKKECEVYDKCRKVKNPGKEWWVDLTNAFLCGTKLYNANLTNVDLWKANLRCVCLNSSDLSGADLRYADLQGVEMRNPIFSDKTNFENAKIAGVISSGPDDPRDSILNIAKQVRQKGWDGPIGIKTDFPIDYLKEIGQSVAEFDPTDLNGEELKHLLEDLGYIEREDMPPGHVDEE